LLPKYLKLIRKLQPDFVHAHHTKAVVAGIVSRLFLRIPFFITIHTNFKHFKLYQRFIWYASCLISDVIICNSGNTKKALPNSIRASKIHVIYNGVDFDKINQFVNDHNNNQDFVIGTVCRMVPAKNLETLLRAFHKFLSASRSNECYLVLIGDGPEKKNLVELSNELNIQDKVIFKGEMSREDVYRELGKLDVFVVSSIYEGFCNAMVEAAGAGVPVVATDIEPLPEVMGRDNARFFPVGDSQALGAILKELEADPKERERLGCAAQEHVVSCYSLEASATKHAELYKSFVQSRKEKRKNY
jgi:glycosyltransferase involved in cell wall biosynthesis